MARFVDDLERRKWKTKSWTSKSGVSHAGKVFTKASLRRFLTNAVYAGNREVAESLLAFAENRVWDALCFRTARYHDPPLWPRSRWMSGPRSPLKGNVLT